MLKHDNLQSIGTDIILIVLKCHVTMLLKILIFEGMNVIRTPLLLQ